MLMITGEAKYADLLERTLYNAFLAGLSLDGQRYIYANPLQVREGHVIRGDDGDYERRPWFHCACCPPNVMRLIASLQHYVALGGDHRLALHQYLPGEYTVDLGSSEAAVAVTSEYPWNGTVTVRVIESPSDDWTLQLRVPEWSASVDVTVNGESIDATSRDGWLDVQRAWSTGDQVVLELDLAPRFTVADPRVDSARGSVAIESGPLVYCLEAIDHPEVRLDDLRIDTSIPATAMGGAVLANIPSVQARATRASGARGSWWPYRTVTTNSDPVDGRIELTAVPYFAWGNRGHGAMRVWIPAIRNPLTSPCSGEATSSASTA
jgi:DUF1680 family protein